MLQEFTDPQYWSQEYADALFDALADLKGDNAPKQGGYIPRTCNSRNHPFTCGCSVMLKGESDES